MDQVANEILKYGGEGIGVATWTLCREMFRLERIPKDWAKGLIVPLYKERYPRVPDNYRGITLLSVVGKLYTSVLNKRLSSWCEKSNVLSEEQAGFRADRCTVDHIFSLSEVVRSRMSQGLETHCCFLDIRKAYDTVFRDGMWKRLLEVGIGGKMWRVLRNIYETVESCVVVGKERTDWFQQNLGLQGCAITNFVCDLH